MKVHRQGLWAARESAPEWEQMSCLLGVSVFPIFQAENSCEFSGWVMSRLIQI